MSQPSSMATEPKSIYTIENDEFLLDIHADTTLIADALRNLGCGVRKDLLRKGVLYVKRRLDQDLIHLA